MTGSNINEVKLIGGKRKNGHKMDCECHICQNMKNKAKRGGYEEEEEYKMGGSKKKNGHRANCKCPICKNMSKAKKGGKGCKKGGGEESESESESDEEKEDEEDESDTQEAGHRKKRGNGHKPDCKCPICKNMRKKGGETENPTLEYGTVSEKNLAGGTRKRSRKANRKTRRHRKTRRSHRKH